MALVLILLMLGIFQAYRRNRRGIDPYLLFICTCAAMVIPQISHDYKLPVLAGPAAILLMTLKLSKKDSKARIILLLGGDCGVFSGVFFHPVFLCDEIAPDCEQLPGRFPNDGSGGYFRLHRAGGWKRSGRLSPAFTRT